MLFARVAGQLLSFSKCICFVFLSYVLSVLSDLNVKSKERQLSLQAMAFIEYLFCAKKGAKF